MSTRPRGRRPAGEDTRGQILAAAAEEFATGGYTGTSLRGIARAAGVDPALLHHYWAGKAELFAETVSATTGLTPDLVLSRVLTGPPEAVGERLIRTFLGVWDAPERRTRLVALLRSAMTHEEAARTLREFLGSEILGRIVTALEGTGDGGAVQLRAELAGAQLMGLAFVRYVLALPAVSTATADELVPVIAPTLQRYLYPE